MAGAKEQMQQFLLAVLDRSLEKLSGRLFAPKEAATDPGTPANVAAPPSDAPIDPVPPESIPATPTIAIAKVAAPAAPLLAGQPASFALTVANQSAFDAAGLTAARAGVPLE